jgi:hypothetical protein
MKLRAEANTPLERDTERQRGCVKNLNNVFKTIITAVGPRYFLLLLHYILLLQLLWFTQQHGLSLLLLHGLMRLHESNPC